MEPRKITEETLAAFADSWERRNAAPPPWKNTCGRSAQFAAIPWAAVR